MSTQKRKSKSRPFPWVCPSCGNKSVEGAKIEYVVNGTHDNREYSVTIPDLPVAKCKDCGEVLLGNSASQHMSDAIRHNLGLLAPTEIREKIRELGITQKQLASEMHVSEETLSRWLSGGIIQSSNSDKRLRKCFTSLENRFEVAASSQPRQRDTVAMSSGEFASLWLSNIRQAEPVQELVVAAHSTWGSWCYEEVA